MKGFVPTPDSLVDTMVAMLFESLPPSPQSVLLDPGCGTGAFIGGVLRWAQRSQAPAPRIVGVDSDPKLLSQASTRFGHHPNVTLIEGDFLEGLDQTFDYVIGNPPYVSILGLSESERSTYRQRFATAVGRFDLYTLFFEQAIRLLRPAGRLVFVTPEKFTYVQSTSTLRRQLADVGVAEIRLLPETTFEGLVTYPAITTIDRRRAGQQTRLLLREGAERLASLPKDGSSWLPFFSEPTSAGSANVLSDAFIRISCGVATGADQVYLVRDAELPTELRPFAHPTISGRELDWRKPLVTTRSMLVPYSPAGELLPEDQLGALGDFLRIRRNHQRLLERTCISRKPWYAFHENPPLSEILRPKLLCKDIAAEPRFILDEAGTIVPRHSVYYLVPTDRTRLGDLCDYLNSEPVARYLKANCQRAANGFLRLQSHVLKQVPLPPELAPQSQFAYA